MDAGIIACEGIRLSSLFASGDVEKRMFSQATRIR